MKREDETLPEFDDDELDAALDAPDPPRRKGDGGNLELWEGDDDATA